MRLTTPRLSLRDFVEADLTRSFAAGQAPPGVSVQAFDFRAPDAVRRQVHDALATAREEPRRVWDLAVVVSATDTLIGRAGLCRGEREPREALVWFVSDPSSWNQGYAGEALTALLDACFGTLQLHRVTAECSPGNDGAAKLFESLGFRREAHHVENAFAAGRWVDTAVFALLEREWRARAKR